MKSRVTLSVAALFIFVAAFFLYLKPQDSQVPSGSLSGSLKLLPSPKEGPIVWLQIQNLAKNETVTFAPSPGGWRIKYPISYPADPMIVNGLMSALRLATKARRLAPQKDWEEYGLLKPGIKVGIETEGRRRRHYLYFGDDSPVSDLVFARWEGEREYFLLDRNMKKIFDQSFYSLCMKQIFRSPLREIWRIRVQTLSKEYEIMRKDEIWAWTEPSGISAKTLSKQQMDEILIELSNLYIKDFLDHEKKDPAALGFHLKNPSITIWTRNSGKPAESLRLGNELGARDSYYALHSEEDIFFLIARDNIRKFFQMIETLAGESGQ